MTSYSLIPDKEEEEEKILIHTNTDTGTGINTRKAKWNVMLQC